MFFFVWVDEWVSNELAWWPLAPLPPHPCQSILRKRRRFFFANPPPSPFPPLIPISVVIFKYTPFFHWPEKFFFFYSFHILINTLWTIVYQSFLFCFSLFVTEFYIYFFFTFTQHFNLLPYSVFFFFAPEFTHT